MKTFVRSFISALAFGLLLTLAGCGGGGGDTQTGPKPFDTSGGTAGSSSGSTTGSSPTVAPTPTVTGAASLSITLANPTSGATTTQVPATARAFVRDANGVAVANAVVTFTVANATLATMTPSSGTALTDSSGVAAIQLAAASFSAAGATTLTATSQVNSAAVTGSIGFSIGASTVSVSTPAFGTNPLSAFGTTSVGVTVTSNGSAVAQQTVSFSSPCASSGKAVLTSSVLTGSTGVATASYRDNGCGASDTITASVSGLASASAALTISVPSAGSIQFVSASPDNITLKGTGGAGRQESSIVTFKVVDTGGNPLSTSQTVTFSLSTSVGGITFANGLTTATASSDPTSGEAVVTVNAGTVSTPVRVLATTTGAGGVTLSTQSDQLTITTGIPDQSRFSIAASTLNIEGFNLDGATTTITARLADHFGNPVPNGTAVNFVAEGGSVGNNGLGSCTTTDGACSATVTSQGTRPTNGRVTILAYAVGEETFIDLDGDGLADSGAELVDVNGVSTDLAEAFLDSNEDRVRNVGETFIDFTPGNTYTAADGKYNGVLCNESAGSTAGTCSTQKSLHIFRNLPLVFATSTARIRSNVASITFPVCTSGVPFTPTTRSVTFTITDQNDNIMPAGTTVAFATSNGTITTTPVSYTVSNSNACLSTSANCPALSANDAALEYTVTLKTAATQDATTLVCTQPTTSPGLLTVTVKTPGLSGVPSSATTTIGSISVTN